MPPAIFWTSFAFAFAAPRAAAAVSAAMWRVCFSRASPWWTSVSKTFMPPACAFENAPSPASQICRDDSSTAFDRSATASCSAGARFRVAPGDFALDSAFAFAFACLSISHSRRSWGRAGADALDPDGAF